MIEELFPNLPFDHETGLRPNTDRAKKAWRFIYDHASVIGLALALVMAI